MVEGVKERLKRFIEYKGISEREFCRRVGVSSSYVESIKKSIQPNKMQAISIQFPELNPIWLLLGNGEMLLSKEPDVMSAPPKEAVSPSLEQVLKWLDEAHVEKARLLSIIESQQRTIESLSEANKKADALLEKVVRCADVG